MIEKAKLFVIQIECAAEAPFAMSKAFNLNEINGLRETLLISFEEMKRKEKKRQPYDIALNSSSGRSNIKATLTHKHFGFETGDF